MKVSRREFVRISSLTAVAGIAAACTQATSTPGPTIAPTPTTAAAATSVPEATAEPVSMYNEAPTLAGKVTAGELPTVDERLPIEPCVAPVLEGIGNYGGAIRRGYTGMADRQGPRKIREKSFIWYTPDFAVRPALAKSWELSDDARVWTWHLREGTKWSDGVPFTSADIQWFWDNRLNNAEITTAPPEEWSSGLPKALATCETPDEYTAIFTFQDPNPLWIYNLAWENKPFTPAHYMEQYHPDFAGIEAVEAKAKEMGYDTWQSLYIEVDDRRDLHPDRPCLDAWICTNKLGEELFLMERNPYFWEVDEAGSQLPYIDTVQHRLFDTAEVLNMWIINGEIDFQGRKLSIANYTIYKEGESSGDYIVALMKNDGFVGICMNQTVQDERLRQFFQNRNVRIAISHAVNRDEMNELIYDGLGTPGQYAPVEGSPQAYPELAKAHIEFDPELANQLLDETGYSEKNSDGMRVWPGTNEIISFQYEGIAEGGSPEEDAAQLFSKYLRDLGIQADYKYLERSLYEERSEVNGLTAGWWGCDRAELPIVDPSNFLGTGVGRPWAPAWGIWYNTGDTTVGEEPPADHWIRRIWSAYEASIVEPDWDRQVELFSEIFEVWKEELPANMFIGQFPVPVVIKNGLRNFVGGYPSGRIRCDENLFGDQTLYWESPEEHTL